MRKMQMMMMMMMMVLKKILKILLCRLSNDATRNQHIKRGVDYKCVPNERHHEKTGLLPMRKQRHRSAMQ